MKNTIMSFMLISTSIFADVSMKESEKKRPDISLPIYRPPSKPIIVYQDNMYHTTIQESCESYIDTINQKDKEIAALKNEIESLRSKEQIKLQKKLQKEHQKELKEFENRKVDNTTKSNIIISDKPID